MYLPPPHRIGKVAVRQRPLVEGGSTIISRAFMFSPIYLRLEDNVPPPQNRNLPVQMESEIARLAAWWNIIFSIAFMLSTIYLRLEGKVPPP